MKQYKFEVIIDEGADEFWDSAVEEDVRTVLTVAIRDYFAIPHSEEVKVQRVGFLYSDEN